MKTVVQLFMILCLATQGFAQNQQPQEKELINGIVLDEDGNPFPGVTINIQGTKDGTQTNLYGNYTVNAAVGETLVFSFNGYEKEDVKVLGANPINLSLQQSPLVKGQVVTTSLGLERKKDEIAFSYKEVDSKHLNQANNPNILSSLEGKVSGMVVNPARTAVMLRGSRSMRGDNTALIVVDGAITNFTFLDAMDPNLIESVNVIKGAAGSALYGSQGSNGVIVVTSKKSNYDAKPSTKSYQPKPKFYRGSLKIKYKNSKPSYIKDLSKESSLDNAYSLYQTQREDYKNHSSYYVDVYRYFANANDKENSKKVLNDVVVSNIDNFETLKGLAMTLQANKEYDFATSVYKRILLLRPRDAQSFIDLAQIYAEKGKTQRAFNLLADLLELTKDASKINGVVRNEVNAMLQTSKNIDKSNLESHNILNTTFDIRVLASWNRENNNINLQVIDPSLEVASKNNPKTQLGGELINVNDAFGPEEYTIRNARKGDYYLGLNYNGDNKSNDEAVFVKLIIYKNFGKANQTKEVKVVKLDKSNGKTIVEKISI
jgi:TonB-dependent SusC/RagA subfamily outer membrane receptor